MSLYEFITKEIFVLDIKFAESLLAVVDEGSIAAAARRQALTATALAQRVQTLERDLGISLIERSGQTVRPTPACLRLLPRLRQITKDVRGLVSDLDPEGLSGPYRLGAISTALADHATQIVSRMTVHAPHCTLTIVPGSSQSLFDELEAGNLDAAIIVRPHGKVSKAICIEPISTQPFILIAPGQGAVPKGLILYDRATWGGRLSQDWIARNKPREEVICEMDDPHVIAALVATGLGCALVPQWSGLEKIPGLRIMPSDDTPNRDVVLAMRGKIQPLDQVVLTAVLR